MLPPPLFYYVLSLTARPSPARTAPSVTNGSTSPPLRFSSPPLPWQGRLSVTDISALPKLPEFFSKLNEVEAFVASVDADPKHVAKGHRVIDFFRGACAATRKDMAAAGVDLAKLPRGLLHGDMSFGNFMCPTGGGPIHLLDFEEACNDACVIELAVTIAFMCVTKPPDLDLALVQPLIEGYATGRGAEFNSDERKAFNFAMRVALLGTCLWRFETYAPRRVHSRTPVAPSLSVPPSHSASQH